MEHYFTIFDSSFLLQGLSLHSSLMKMGGDFHLWIIAGDQETEESLSKLNLKHASVIPLRELETQELLRVKPGRTRREYFWTLTPFGFDAVFQRASAASRVTYLDADLFFLGSPAIILDEFSESGKQVLITDHAYAPEYDQSATSGRFCVQFLTFTARADAAEVRREWQRQCLEWCFASPLEGRYGDQKYLDAWPRMYGTLVHVYTVPFNTLAPWNARYLENPGMADPVFFHFHGARVLSRRLVQLRAGYRIGRKARNYYTAYLSELRANRNRVEAAGIQIRSTRIIGSPLDYLRIFRSLLRRTIRFAWL